MFCKQLIDITKIFTKLIFKQTVEYILINEQFMNKIWKYKNYVAIIQAYLFHIFTLKKRISSFLIIQTNLQHVFHHI